MVSLELNTTDFNSINSEESFITSIAEHIKTSCTIGFEAISLVFICISIGVLIEDYMIRKLFR